MTSCGFPISVVRQARRSGKQGLGRCQTSLSLQPPREEPIYGHIKTSARRTRLQGVKRLLVLCFLLLFLLYLFNYVDRMVVAAIFPYLKVDWGLTDTQCGWFASIVTLMMTVLFN